MQLISIPEWGSSTFGTFFPYFNLFMAVLGWVGVRRQHLGLIVSVRKSSRVSRDGLCDAKDKFPC
jgi:hypothetical protein